MNPPKTFNIPPHAIVTEYHYVDNSDEHGEIAWSRSLQLHPSEKRLALWANLVAFEQPGTGRGFVWVRLAPTARVRTWDAEPSLTLTPAQSRILPPPPAPPPPPPEPPPPAPAGAPDTGWTAAVGATANPCEEIFIAYEGGAAGRTRALQCWQRARCPYKPGRDGVLLSNTWGDRSRAGRMCEAFVLAEIDRAADYGADVVQLDDGWQKGRTSNTVKTGGVWNGFWAAAPDYWTPDPERFPRGLEPVAAHARRRDAAIGLWYAPDSSGDFANWEKDAATLLDLWRRHGVRHFKLDGVKLLSPLCEHRFRLLLDLLRDGSGGEIIADLDTTAEARLGFWGRPAGAAIFVENRYTDWRNYYPHSTLRALWTLARTIHPMRLRMEFLNAERNDALYAGDPLRPALHQADYLFASVMLASPLAWFENTGLSPGFITTLKPLVALWKQWRAEFYNNDVLPLGAPPDGHAWTGFAVVNDGGCALHLLIFREATAGDRGTIDPPAGVLASHYKLLAGQGGARIENGRLHVHLPNPRTFCWLRAV
ncbi:MAG: alpha-galactosidase [Opitutaceae bacterium]|nr:alpha-galactosidase [Opitutaceae bacterium]